MRKYFHAARDMIEFVFILRYKLPVYQVNATESLTKSMVENKLTLSNDFVLT